MPLDSIKVNSTIGLKTVHTESTVGLKAVKVGLNPENYYTKEEIDNLLNQKQPKENAATTDTDQVFSGHKTFGSFNLGDIYFGSDGNIIDINGQYEQGVNLSINLSEENPFVRLPEGCKINPNDGQYGLVMPNTNDYTENKVIATTDDIVSYSPFKSDWPTSNSYTTKQFCDILDADDTVKVGMAYYGGAKWSDVQALGMSNGDVKVEITEGPNKTKSIHIVLSSGDIAPYH